MLCVRHPLRRNAFPVTVEIKILQHAVPLHIGKHLMPKMGGGLIRAYRRPQGYEGQAALCCPRPAFFKVTVGQHDEKGPSGCSRPRGAIAGA